MFVTFLGHARKVTTNKKIVNLHMFSGSSRSFSFLHIPSGVLNEILDPTKATSARPRKLGPHAGAVQGDVMINVIASINWSIAGR